MRHPSPRPAALRTFAHRRAGPRRPCLLLAPRRLALTVIALAPMVGPAVAQTTLPPPSSTDGNAGGSTDPAPGGIQGGTRLQPRGTPGTAGTTGAIPPGPATSERERRAQERSDSTTKGICQGC